MACASLIRNRSNMTPSTVSIAATRASVASSNPVATPARCSVPLYGGTPETAWRDALWDRFSTAAPQRLRRSVGQSKLVKRA